MQDGLPQMPKIMSDEELGNLIKSTLVEVDVSKISVDDNDFQDPDLLGELEAMEKGQEYVPSPKAVQKVEQTQSTQGSQNRQVNQSSSGSAETPKSVSQSKRSSGSTEVSMQGSENGGSAPSRVNKTDISPMEIDIDIDNFDKVEVTNVLELIYIRQGEYTAQAKHYKSIDRDKTMEIISVLKELKHLKEQVENGVQIDRKKIPGPPPSISENPKGIITVSAPPPEPVPVSSWRDDQFDSIGLILRNSIAKHHNFAFRAKNNKKIDLAKKHIDIKKELERDLERLTFSKSIPAIPPPLFHYEEHRHEEEEVNEDLGPYDFLVEICEVRHLLADGYSNITLYFVIDLPYPDSKKPQRFTSRSTTVSGPQFISNIENATQIFKVDRKKQFPRFVASRKITVSLYHKRGFIFSDVLLGTAEVIMDELTDSVESEVVVEVMNGRQKTGGTIRVKLGLREPAGGKQLKVWNEKRLVIDKHYTLEDIHNNPSLGMSTSVPYITQTPTHITNSPTAENITNSPTPRSVTNNPQPRSVESTPSPPPVTNTPKTVTNSPIQTGANTPQPVTNAPQPTSQNTEQLPDTTALSWLISNAVLESEIAKCETLIAQNKSQGKDVTNETIRLRMLESQVDVLIYNIQEGILTQELYIEMVAKKIDEEKETAKKYAEAGDKKTALECLRRMGIMKTELGLD